MGEAVQAPGTPPPARRRRLLRGAALLTGAALVTGLLQTAQATGSAAAPATAEKAVSGSRTASLSLDSLTPRIPAKGDTVTVSGAVKNNGKTTITGARIAIHVGPGGPLRTLSAMRSAASRVEYNSAQDSAELNGHNVKVSDLAAGRSAPFTIKIPVSALDLGVSGVYQLGVSLDGQDAAEPWDHVLGIKRTFVPWYADGETAKSTRLSYLWPLTDRPHIASRGDTDSQQSPIFLDDSLTAELKPGGRLGRMVDLGKNLPVSWVVDPDLLATVEAMTKPYRVAGAGGDLTRTTPGTGTAVAEQWLNSLKTAIAGDEVVALPFGDPDLASLAHRGKNLTSNVDLLTTGTALGKTTVDTILGVQSTAGVAWPVNGAVDPSIVSLARRGGANRIIARSDSLQESGTLGYTPNAARPIGGGTTAVVADASLSTAFDGDMSSDQNANLAVQNFIAQTLLITMQAPDKQRTVVVAPPRMPDIQQAKAMHDAIMTTGTGQWSNTVDFETAAKAHADPHASHKIPPLSAYPRSLRKQELSADTFQQLHQDQIGLNGFVVILTIKDRVTVPFRNAMLRAMSTGWRGRPAAGGRLRERDRQLPERPDRRGAHPGQEPAHPVRPQRHRPGHGEERPQPAGHRPGAEAQFHHQHQAEDPQSRAADLDRRRPYPYPEVPDHGERQRSGRHHCGPVHPERLALRQQRHLVQGEHHQGDRPRDADHRGGPVAAGARGGTDLPSAQAPGRRRRSGRRHGRRRRGERRHRPRAAG